MPIHNHFIPSLGCIYSRYVGVIEADDFITAFTNGIAHKDYVLGMPELLDLSEVERVEMDFSTASAILERTTAFYRTIEGPIYKSLYAPGDLAYGMARMYQTKASLTEHAPIYTIHKDFAQALDALRIPQQDFLGWLDENGHAQVMAKLAPMSRRPA